METSRLETFSDGVFAIAATLLILDVSLPAGGTGSLAHQLAHLWPSYAGYAVSFVTIGVMWINHHAVFKLIDHIDRTFLTINVIFLLLIAFVPFPTHVLALHLHRDAQTAAFFYGLMLTLTAVMWQAVWFYASTGRRLLSADADLRVVRGITRAFLPGVPIYAIAMLSALVSSWLSVVLYAAITTFYVIESSLFARG